MPSRLWRKTQNVAEFMSHGKLPVQAVMYEPMPDGKLVLIAAEYITFKGPAALEGHMMNYNSAPNSYGLPEFYELQVWAWKANPRGTFADDNPDVSCDAVKLDSK